MRMSLLPSDNEGVAKVAKVVRGGGVIVFPTDTVYGIGCDPFNRSALGRVHRLKGRGGKALPVLVSSSEAASALVEVEGIPELLMRAFWPGALTLVLKGRRRLPHLLTGGAPGVGVRMPSHELALKIIGACGGALVGTSANLSGRPPARSADELDPQIEAGADLVVDGGPAALGVASTVIEVHVGGTGEGTSLRVLREGGLAIDAIKSRVLEWEREGIKVAFI